MKSCFRQWVRQWARAKGKVLNHFFFSVFVMDFIMTVHHERDEKQKSIHIIDVFSSRFIDYE